MLYALMHYHDEAITAAQSASEEAAVFEQFIAAQCKLGRKFEPAVRLMPSTTATSFRKHNKFITDGPVADMREQLLGFYIVEAGCLEEAHSVAQDLREANPTASYEVRPIMDCVQGRAINGTA